jgi:hypothetical protein
MFGNQEIFRIEFPVLRLAGHASLNALHRINVYKEELSEATLDRSCMSYRCVSVQLSSGLNRRRCSPVGA